MRYLVLVLLLAGCASPQERADRAIARHGPYCDQMGFQRNTDAWRNCVATQDANARTAGAIGYQTIQKP